MKFRHRFPGSNMLMRQGGEGLLLIDWKGLVLAGGYWQTTQPAQECLLEPRASVLSGACKGRHIWPHPDPAKTSGLTVTAHGSRPGCTMFVLFVAWGLSPRCLAVSEWRAQAACLRACWRGRTESQHTGKRTAVLRCRLTLSAVKDTEDESDHEGGSELQIHYCRHRD